MVEVRERALARDDTCARLWGDSSWGKAVSGVTWGRKDGGGIRFFSPIFYF